MPTPTNQTTNPPTNLPTQQHTNEQPQGHSPNQPTSQPTDQPTKRQQNHQPTNRQTNHQPTVNKATERPTGQPMDQLRSGGGRRQLRRLSILEAAVCIHDFAQSSTEGVFDVLPGELSRRSCRLTSRTIIQGAQSQILPLDFKAHHPGGQSSRSIPTHPQALIKVPQ